MGDGHVVIAHHAGDHFIEGAVTAAGVDAQLLAGLGGLTGNAGTVSRRLGAGDLKSQPPLLAGLSDLVGKFHRVVVFTCRGIDDEQVLHGSSS